MPAVAVPPLLMTPEEAAAHLRIKRSKLYQLVATGQLRSLKIGRLRRIFVRDAEAFAERLAAEQGGGP